MSCSVIQYIFYCKYQQYCSTIFLCYGSRKLENLNLIVGLLQLAPMTKQNKTKQNKTQKTKQNKTKQGDKM